MVSYASYELLRSIIRKKYSTMKGFYYFRKSLPMMAVLLVSTVVGQGLIDKEATAETKALYQNLKKLSDKNIMFGHQDGDA